MTKSIRLVAAFGAAASLFLSTNLHAQQADTENDSVEIIEVTGSRIARPELSTPAPVITISAEEIARFGTPDLGSILAELPAIAAGSTLIGNNNSNSRAGLSSPDLRSLGENRTLTLINGKRHVAGSPTSSAIDTGAIPTAMIDRIEVITGGASAIYGSDAVSGVINIILKDDYEGTEVRLTGANDTESIGAKSYGFSILSGATTEDGRGNVTFFAGYDHIREVMISDLQQSAAWGTVVNPEDTGETDGIVDRFRVPFVGSEMINNFGVINPFGGDRFTFSPSGQVIEQVERINTNSFAFGNFDQFYETVYYGDDDTNYSPNQGTLTLASTFRYNITDDIRFYGDFKYVDKDIQQQFQPSFRFGNISINVEDNAYLPEEARQRLLDGGQKFAPMARFFGDIGNRSALNDRKLWRVVSGVEGAFTLSKTDFDWDVFYTRGETSNERLTINSLIPTNLLDALDSVVDPDTGKAACRSDVSSAQGEDYTKESVVGTCAPFNPFGFNQASAEAQDFVSANVSRFDEITQEVYGATLAFDTSEFLELPGGAIGIAVGYEYREETSEMITDEFTKAGLTANAATPDSFGSFDVEEFFAEVRVPILADVAFAHELSIDAAFRGAEYSHAGGADAWQIGFMWTPIEDFKIRGTFGEAVRAPNVDEAFSPLSPGFSSISDPCDVDNINDDPDRAANCLALGIPAGFEANDNVSIQIFSGGNPDLFSEKSESQTIGIVHTPSYIENFSIIVDWYDIKISDAIIDVSAQDILDNCVDASGGPDQDFCQKIVRGADKDIDSVSSGFINAAALDTSGIEAQILYSTDLADYGLPGELRFNISVNKVFDLNQFDFQNRPDEINVEVGEVGDPGIQLRSSIDYRIDDISFNWTSRLIERSFTLDISPGGDIPEDTSPAFVPSVWTHDLAVTYNFNDHAEINFGVRNLFNKVPPGYTMNPLYDLLGRRFNATLTYSFN